ncbi:hypothetical protein PR048_001023 [Dryococelus australis]|uniref:Uncharacterized protein n=1 Tax=Dryococelus australis TaxID=614101 RepID=A0ABQ9IGU1_9NEOP|nr:hypothetical protein PR048_001023 [Dryococelus australis]
MCDELIKQLKILMLVMWVQLQCTENRVNVQDRLTTLLVKLAHLEVGKGHSEETKNKGNSKVRLPKLQLPVFIGNLQE